MSPEQFTAVLVALTGLIAAMGIVIHDLRQVHTLVNSRLTELLELTRVSSRAAGRLEGQQARGLPDAPK